MKAAVYFIEATEHPWRNWATHAGEMIKHLEQHEHAFIMVEYEDKPVVGDNWFAITLDEGMEGACFGHPNSHVSRIQERSDGMIIEFKSTKESPQTFCSMWRLEWVEDGP